MSATPSLRYGTWCSTPHPAFAIMDLMSIGMQTTFPRRMATLQRRSLLVRARLSPRLSQLSCGQWQMHVHVLLQLVCTHVMHGRHTLPLLLHMVQHPSPPLAPSLAILDLISMCVQAATLTVPMRRMGAPVPGSLVVRARWYRLICRHWCMHVSPNPLSRGAVQMSSPLASESQRRPVRGRMV